MLYQKCWFGIFENLLTFGKKSTEFISGRTTIIFKNAREFVLVFFCV